MPTWKYSLEGYGNAEPLSTEFKEDDRTLINPSAARSSVYDSFPSPFCQKKNGFDFHSPSHSVTRAVNFWSDCLQHNYMNRKQSTPKSCTKESGGDFLSSKFIDYGTNLWVNILVSTSRFPLTQQDPTPCSIRSEHVLTTCAWCPAHIYGGQLGTLQVGSVFLFLCQSNSTSPKRLHSSQHRRRAKGSPWLGDLDGSALSLRLGIFDKTW